jgi:hypothetical protein
MEYTNLWQPITVIFVSFSIGVLVGAAWMFYSLLDGRKKLEEELDAKNIVLDKFKKDL